MLVGNVLGATVTGTLLRCLLKNTNVVIPITSICDNKTSFESSTYFKCVLNGIYCGLCVYFSVATYTVNARNICCVSVVLIQFFVPMFVYNGFEHCIANVFYFAVGSVLGNKYAYINFALVLLGNTIGTIPGAILLHNFKSMLEYKNRQHNNIDIGTAFEVV